MTLAHRLFPILGGLLAFSVIGCEDLTESDPVTVSVSAPENTVAVGVTLQLGATVSPSGESQAVTWMSSNLSRATVSGAGLVEGVSEGPVTIMATSLADASASGSVELQVTRCDPLATADVQNGATLRPDICYDVGGNVSVSGGTLTLQPGSRIEFGESGGLTIGNNGRLNAVGTSGEPITLTSANPSGSWRGVNFDGSRGAENVLSYVNIENGGSTGWSGASFSRSAVYLQDDALVTIRNSTMSGSGGQGITVLGGSEMTFEDNMLSGNAVAAWVHPDAAGSIDGSTIFDGNTANVVRVVFDNTNRVTTAQSWQALSVPYEIQNRFYVEGALTLEPGATLAFVENASMIVQDGGSLRAVGTPEDGIAFRSTDQDVIYWKGLAINTASADNVFRFVTFENGGSEGWSGAEFSRSTVYLYNGSRAEFSDSRFVGSQDFGMIVPADAVIPGFERNVFDANARAMMVHPNRAGSIAASNTFIDNLENKVRVTFDNTNAVAMDQTWQDLGVPFYINLRTYVQEALTISAGTEIEFAQNARLVVNNDGSLRVEGTMGDPVIFRGGENVVGHWVGIQFDTSSPENVLEHTLIANAGSGAWFGGSNSTGSVHVTGDGSLDLMNVTFQQTGGYAVILSSGATLTCTVVEDSGFGFYDHGSQTAFADCSVLH